MAEPSASDLSEDRREGRDETPYERADRNWNEMLQELRVLQTGAQILAGFLLALAFQPAFGDLDDGQRVLYLSLVVLAGVTSITALAPVAVHRLLFRQRVKAEVVSLGHAAVIAALVLVAVLVIGVVAFVFDVVLGGSAAWLILAALGTLVIAAWVLAPLVVRTRRREERGSA
ncbi:DUF6328 family protein [Microbacterium xanthum]|uniref:DUF6328 family protein n=1 Tax=Microbacterium xanthum TaxID=3079794 RepID=UPI002AD360C5|nr:MULTISPECIES: DUF6328 family protein [unclassified Microbacterium]MDZ8172175.1 DUF6328 family protein [Microbacterium sp. KSW-48]MDZ8202118.1 DUF6328 family protein [Microbacterium sp. SSW1-59]